MTAQHTGRHRAPHFNALDEIAGIASRAAQPAVKVSGIALASGGLVAAFAIPASAATSSDPSGAVAARSQGALTAAEAVPAVVAPAIDPSSAPTFGVIGFTVEEAPTKPVAPIVITKITPPAPAAASAPPAPTAPSAPTAPAAPSRASRSTTRVPTPAPAATTAPKPAPAAAPAPTGGIIGIAASLSGIPYVWGGTTTAGFDCSGYTGYIYRQVGKSLPRTAEQQRVASTKVTNPVPGDLIFFGYPAYHVGIYAGAGKMYASSRPGELTGLKAIWTQTDVSYGRF